MERKATNRHVFLRMVGEIEMSLDWFGNIFIIELNIYKVFAETIASNPNLFLLTTSTSTTQNFKKKNVVSYYKAYLYIFERNICWNDV